MNGNLIGTYTLGYGPFIVKYDSDGNIIWVNSIPGANEANGVVSDNLGNVFVTGSFSGTLVVGNSTVTSSGFRDVFIIKYNNSGNPIWARTAGGTNTDESFSVCLDQAGNSIITGYFASPSITFGTYTLSTTLTSRHFVVKYDPNGNVLWATS